MPSKLYKYFPNKMIDGRNYSKEALENNTLFLQRRIEHYAKICGMKTNEEWDYNRCAWEISLFLYNEMSKGTTLEQIFGIKQLLTPEDYRCNIFCLNLKALFIDAIDVGKYDTV